MVHLAPKLRREALPAWPIVMMERACLLGPSTALLSFLLSSFFVLSNLLPDAVKKRANVSMWGSKPCRRAKHGP